MTDMQRFYSLFLFAINKACIVSSTVQLASDNRTCHATVSDSCWRHFCFVSWTKTQFESPFNSALEILLVTYLHTRTDDYW